MTAAEDDANRREAEALAAAVPYVVIGHGQEVPWGHDLSCPVCGEPDLPLHDSVPPLLTYIKHCGQVWVRGSLKL